MHGDWRHCSPQKERKKEGTKEERKDKSKEGMKEERREQRHGGEGKKEIKREVQQVDLFIDKLGTYRQKYVHVVAALGNDHYSPNFRE